MSDSNKNGGWVIFDAYSNSERLLACWLARARSIMHVSIHDDVCVCSIYFDCFFSSSPIYCRHIKYIVYTHRIGIVCIIEASLPFPVIRTIHSNPLHILLKFYLFRMLLLHIFIGVFIQNISFLLPPPLLLLFLLFFNCLCDSLIRFSVAPFLVSLFSRVIYLKPDLSVMRIYITCHFFPFVRCDDIDSAAAAVFNIDFCFSRT